MSKLTKCVANFWDRKMKFRVVLCDDDGGVIMISSRKEFYVYIAPFCHAKPNFCIPGINIYEQEDTGDHKDIEKRYRTVLLAGIFYVLATNICNVSKSEGWMLPSFAPSRYGEFFVSLCVSADRYSHLARNDDAYTYLSSYLSPRNARIHKKAISSLQPPPSICCNVPAAGAT